MLVANAVQTSAQLIKADIQRITALQIRGGQKVKFVAGNDDSQDFLGKLGTDTKFGWDSAYGALVMLPCQSKVYRTVMVFLVTE